MNPFSPRRWPAFVTAALFAALALLPASGTRLFAAVARPFPTILVVLADDLDYGDVQCYNLARGKITTPQAK